MPRRYMGLKRFQQIKRFFHVADPDPEAAVQEAIRLDLKPNQMWWYKLEPLHLGFAQLVCSIGDPPMLSLLMRQCFVASGDLTIPSRGQTS
jgi:hypothetical protein